MFCSDYYSQFLSQHVKIIFHSFMMSEPGHHITKGRKVQIMPYQ